MRSPSGSDAICAADSAGRLDKHEELAREAAATRQNLVCTCGPKYLRLRSEHGELVKPRGGSVNLCEYCAKLAAVENCEMLVLDALDGNAPAILMVLTTRTATIDMGAFRQARQQLIAVLRRRWPDVQYASEVEFTTGYGPRSGGQRRPHWNWFIKGVPVSDIDEMERLSIATWCRLVDAEPAGQYVAPIENAIGVTKYVTEHFMKASQRPPAGFTGQRFNTSLRYFGTMTRAQARARAKDSLALKRELWKAAQRSSDAHEVELTAQLAHRRNVATRWVLASETGARLSAAAIPLRSPRERLELQRAIRDRRAFRRLAQLLAPDWMPHRETLFSDRA